MADQEKRVTLYGRVFIIGDIKAMTGLHIGGASGALAIGGAVRVVWSSRSNRELSWTKA